MTKYSSGYLREVDGFRALAVISVLLFHLNSKFLPGGFAGVDVFFVISGYVVSKAIAGRKSLGFSNYISEFYVRRILRIVPALLFCLLLTSLVTVLFVPASWLSQATDNVGLSAFFGLSNIALIQNNDGYFSPRMEFNPFVHTWSLAVEEQFYFLFPLMFYFWVSDLTQVRIRKLLLRGILPLLGFASFLMAIFYSKKNPDYGYYLLPGRFWELAVGAGLFLFQRSGLLSPKSQAFARIQILIGCVLVCLGLWFSVPAHFPYPWAILPVLGTAFLLNSVSVPEQCNSIVHSLFRSKPAIWFGKISYSLYLWHWPVFTLFRWTIGLQSPLSMVLACGLALPLSCLSYYSIETSVRSISVGGMKRSLVTIVTGLLVVMVCSLIGKNLFKHREQLSLSMTRDMATWYPYETPNLKASSVEQPLKGRTLFVVGDSHTGAFSAMLQMAELDLGVKVEKIYVPNCPIGNLLHPAENTDACHAAITGFSEKIKRDGKEGDYVFFASLRAYRISDQWTRFDLEEVLKHSRSEEAAQELKKSFEETSQLVSEIEQKKMVPIFNAPMPVLRAPLFRCADWFNHSNPICGNGEGVAKSTLQAMRTPVLESLKRLKESHNRTQIWDVYETLCPGEVCTGFDSERKPLFFDGDHLSGHGNRVLYPLFSKFLKSI